MVDVEKLTMTGKINYKQIMDAKEPYEDFLKKLEKPMEHNAKFLQNILDDNKDTEYGKKYGFGDIHSVKEFQERVPVTTYDDYADAIIRMTEYGEKNIICAYPVNHYNKTSGTMGNPKRIPLSDKGLEIYLKYTGCYVNGLIGDLFPNFEGIDGKSLTLLESKPVIGRLKCGATYGSISEKLLIESRDYLSLMYAAPDEAYFPDAGTSTRYLQARFGLADKNIVSIGGTFYSFMAELLRYIELNWELLVDDIEKGTVSEKVPVSVKARESLAEKLRPMPERAAELREIFSAGFDEPFMPKVWPHLNDMRGTGSASYQSYIDKIRNSYAGDSIPMIRFGIAASEGVMSVAYKGSDADSVLIPDGMFYEFLPLDAGDDFSKIVTLDGLEVGKEYEMIITNTSGFYRYRMRDAIIVTGKYKNTPTIDFLYRIDKTVSITGEKTTEIALQNTVCKTAEQLNLDVVGFSVLPDTDAIPVRYTFFMELAGKPFDVRPKEIRHVLEQNLAKANPSMGDKVKRGICGATRINFLEPETYMLYRDLMSMKGIAAPQIKPVTVISSEVQRRFFCSQTEYSVELLK